MGVVIDAAARGYPNTSLRWVVASLVAVLGFSVWAVVDRQHRITTYEAGYAAASQRADATVVISEDFRRRQDYITVEWTGTDGVVRRHSVDVGNASAHPVGSALPLRVSSTSPDRVFPDSSAGIDETSPWRTTIVVLVSAMIIAVLLFLHRAVQWWRAARGPARRYRAHVWYSYGKWEVFGIPWLSIVDGDDTCHQRLMWEPWVQDMKEGLVVEARRVGRGPFVVDVPGYGRLWPAGRARRRQPRMEQLVSRHASRFRLSRLCTVAAATVFLLQGVLLAGWTGWLAITGYVWLLALYLGGPPTAVPVLLPKAYPPIKGLRSFSPTEAPARLAPVPPQRRPKGSRRRARRAGPGSM